MYVIAGYGAEPSAGCKLTQNPAGWVPPAEMGGCLQWNGSDCAALAQKLLAGATQPYFGLPFPMPAEAQIVNWLMNYGYVSNTKANACQIQVAGDVSIYDAKQWGGWAAGACQVAAGVGLSDQCQKVAFEMGQYNVPFAQWMKQAADQGNGVVLAGRPVKFDPLGRSQGWDVQSAEFIAPTVDDDLPLNLLGGFVPPQVQGAVKTYLAALKAILLASQGKLGKSKDLFIVYAPALANLGIPGVNGFGWFGDSPPTFVIPPLPQIQVAYPDGRGGVITVGTQTPPPSNQPPPGAPPVKSPEQAGLPSEKLMQWTTLVGTGLGIVVAGTTLYFMLKGKKAP